MKSFYHPSLLLLTFCTALFAQAQQPYSPHPLIYDPARLKAYSTVELIDLLAQESIEKNARAQGMYSVLPPDQRRLESPPGADPKLYMRMQLDQHATDYAASVEQELASRGAYQELAAAFESTTDHVQRYWITDTLSHMRGAQADSILRRHVSKAKDETTYLALKYFAAACDSNALHTLNQNYFKYEGLSSAEWSSIVRSFGDCKYKPATQNLVDTVNAMMVELGFASHRSLLAIYPDAKIEFGDPLQTQTEWKTYLKRHPATITKD